MLTEGVTDFNRGTGYLNNKRYDKALQFFKRSVKVSPVKEVYLNMANCLSALDRDMDAAHFYGLAADPATPHFNGTTGPYPIAVNNLGLINYRYGSDQEAINCYLTTLEADPLNWDCIWNYSNALLRQCVDGVSSEWNTAWKMYSYRFKRNNGSYQVDPNFRVWDGLTKVTKLVVLHEQGQGDKLQFARWLGVLKGWCDELVLQCEPELHKLFQDHGYTTVWNEGLYDHLDGWGIPWCTMPQHLGLEHTVPCWIDKTLYKPTVFSGGGKNIIVHNSGNPAHANDRNRSCTWDNFKDLTDFGNLWTLKSDGPPWLNKLSSGDWNTTISHLLGCDCVVTVDTSVAHMAGCLGVKTYLLQPLKETDWRWGNTGTVSMWYPTITIIRNPNSWKKTFNELKTLLSG